MEQYNESIHLDKHIYAQDVRGSIARNSKPLKRDLREVETEWAEGSSFVIKSGDEDIHTANKRRLGEIMGKNIAGKLHTGGSRNDQVATGMGLRYY
ncbi:hypothetical protein DV737_g117, partial [Chaetothyriales sp. CBS 132003]